MSISLLSECQIHLDRMSPRRIRSGGTSNLFKCKRHICLDRMLQRQIRKYQTPNLY